MIPKIIHQFNIENSNESKERIDRIRRKHKNDWSHRLWKLKDVKNLYPHAPDKFKDKFEFFLKKGMHKNAEDIAKFLILKVDGGFYIDEGFVLVGGKNLNEIPFKDGNLVLFNSMYRRDEKYRFQETIIGAAPNHPFMTHLLDYIDHKDYLPRCPFDGKILEIYSSGYITTHYLLYNQIYNNSRIHTGYVSRVLAKDLKSSENEIIINPNCFFVPNQSMVLKHNIQSKQFQ